jgi:ribosomal protein S12
MLNYLITSIISCNSNENAKKQREPLMASRLEESDYGTTPLSKGVILSKKDIQNKQPIHNLYIESRIKFNYNGQECVLKIRHQRYPIK